MSSLVAATALLTASGALAVFGAPAGQADTAPAAGLPATVSADGLATVQINGVVWAQVTVGNTVYATGSFTQARPAGVAVGGTGSVARSNLLAYDITTGKLITSFNHSLNAAGLAIAASPDGSRLYVAGNFTTVDGATHNRIAAFSTATGGLVTTFTGSLNNSVKAVAASNSTVYVGGSFSTANGSARSHLAAFTSGGALTTWNPGANGTVDAVTNVVSAGRLVVGGSFSALAGATAIGMGSVDAASGASEPWAANAVIQDSGTNAAILSLTNDGNQVYGTGYFFTTGGNFEGRFAANPATGQLAFLNNCHGDSYAVLVIGPVLYSAGHEHDCADIGWFPQDNPSPIAATHHFLAAEMTIPNGQVDRHPLYPGGNGVPGPHYHDFAGQPVATQLDWYPTLTEGTYTGQNQAAWSLSGNAQYVSAGGEFPTVNGVAQQGLVRFAISSIAPNKIGPTAASTLTPRAYAQTPGTARVAWQTTWDRDNLTLTYSLYRDNGATPIYSVSQDSAFWSRPNLGYLDTGLTPGSTHTYKVVVVDPYGNSVTSGSTTVTVGSSGHDPYSALVLADGADHLWPLSEAKGTTSAADQAGFADLTLAGAIALGATGPVAGSAATAAIFGGGETTPPGNGQPGPPPQPVPNDTAGTIGTISPGGAFSVEAWVKTTSTQGGEIVGLGLYGAADSAAIDKVLYLDAAGHVYFGVQNNTVPQTIASTGTYNDGAWHLVDATFSGTSAHLFVDGTQVASSSSMIDDIAFPGYWRVGGDKLAGWPAAPTSNYLAGTIGDVATYPSALSSSAISGHYTAGTGGAVIPNQPPVATFTASCVQLTCTVDAGASTDSDGTIVSYGWNFGDGATTTGSTASHPYTTAGTDTITLTVTDNDGSSASTTRVVTPTSGALIYASDLFARTVSGGFGSAAPTGGAWTSYGKTADLSVAPGAAKITLPAAALAGAYLGTVSATNADVLTSLSIDLLPVAGNGYYFYVLARRVSASETYLVRVRVLPGTGQIRLSLSKYDGTTNTEVVLSPEVAAGTVSAGAQIHVRSEAVGISPTILRARVWIGAAAEPSTWLESISDSSAGLQSPGSVGVQGYLSGSVTNGPIAVSLSGFTAGSP